MGLPPSCDSLNAACPSEPTLCLLDRTGLWGDRRKVLVDRKQRDTWFGKGFRILPLRTCAAIFSGIQILHWMKMLQHVKYLHTGC